MIHKFKSLKKPIQILVLFGLWLYIPLSFLGISIFMLLDIPSILSGILEIFSNIGAMLLLFYWLLAFAGIGMLIYILFNRSLRYLWIIFLLLLVSPLGREFSMRTYYNTRLTIFKTAGVKAQKLIDAVEKYNFENGSYPEKFEDITPVYLEKVPGTGIGQYPKFEYSLPGTYDIFKKYQIKIRASLGLMKWDVFIYWPEEEYPDNMYGGYVTRLGSWAYVNE